MLLVELRAHQAATARAEDPETRASCEAAMQAVRQQLAALHVRHLPTKLQALRRERAAMETTRHPVTAVMRERRLSMLTAELAALEAEATRLGVDVEG